MNNNNSKGGSDKANAIAAIDLLLNLLMIFVVIAAIAIAKMNKPDARPSVQMKAELVIEMTWPDNNFDDLDLWLLLPDGQRVGFNGKDVGIATLDRDDRGGYGDTYFAAEGAGVQVIRVNKEVTTIRANRPGKYVVNVHYYNDFSGEEIGAEETDATPNPVTVKMTKLNPKVVELVSRKLEVGKVGTQRTAFCFELNAQGEVSHLDQTCSLPFIETIAVEPEPKA
jgi:hypothetical protein